MKLSRGKVILQFILPLLPLPHTLMYIKKLNLNRIKEIEDPQILN